MSGHTRSRDVRALSRGARAAARRTRQARRPARHRRHARADRRARRRRDASRKRTRQLLIRLAGRYGRGRLRQRPPGLARPARWCRSARSPTSARTGPSCCGPDGPSRRSIRALERVGASGSQAFGAGGRRRRAPPQPRPDRGQGADRRLSTGAARADEDGCPGAGRADRRARRGRGPETHWGRKVLEVRAAGRIDKGVGITKLLSRAEGPGRAVRRGRRHRPRRVPRPARAPRRR